MSDLFDDIDPPRKVVLPRPCKCGSHHFKVLKGEGPHAAGLRCFVCGEHAGWLSKEETYGDKLR